VLLQVALSGVGSGSDSVPHSLAGLDVTPDAASDESDRIQLGAGNGLVLVARSSIVNVEFINEIPRGLEAITPIARAMNSGDVESRYRDIFEMALGTEW